MHLRDHVKSLSRKPAITIMETGEQLTFAELEDEANKAANLFRSKGCQTGDVVAFCLDNSLDVFKFVWGAQRAGLLYLAVSTHLTTDEIAFILKDSGAKLVLASDVLANDKLQVLSNELPDIPLFKTGFPLSGWSDWSEELSNQSTKPIADESAGFEMLYSSGTTGRPKGIVPRIELGQPVDIDESLSERAINVFNLTPNEVYLSPAPLYHAAPLRWCMAITRIGGSVIVIKKFKPELILQATETYSVTVAQFVPTHFVRMLALDEPERAKYDVSSLKMVMHAAAPCPIDVKQKMIDWWGPILVEYYAGSENIGMTMINTEEWLKKPGSVGRSVMGIAHACDKDGIELPVNSEGAIYFSGGPQFDYHNNPEGTKKGYNKQGWASYGDVGKIDEDGFLFLTDRKSFMIITGGVNVYPQETENHLQSHPDVFDVAVLGKPDSEMGEMVVAVIQLNEKAPEKPEAARSEELKDFCREKLSGIKTPREYIFVDSLGRTPTGKLPKHKIRDELWGK